MQWGDDVNTVVITGVSRGLGAALFDELVDADDRVMAIGRRFTAEQQARARALPDQVTLWQADLTTAVSLPTPAELSIFLAGASQVALVHNAAVIEPLGAIGTLQWEQIVRGVSVNLVAPMLLTNALLAALAEQGGTPAPPYRQITVLFISSSAAHRINGGRAVYAATKRAGEVFFETLAAEHHSDARVRAAVVDPGIMDTPMQARIRGHVLRGGYLPGGERYLRLAAERVLPSPVEVARKITAEHLRYPVIDE